METGKENVLLFLFSTSLGNSLELLVYKNTQLFAFHGIVSPFLFLLTPGPTTCLSLNLSSFEGIISAYIIFPFQFLLCFLAGRLSEWK